MFSSEKFMFHILGTFLQTKPFVSEAKVRMAGTSGGEWKIFKLEAEEELRVEVDLNKRHNNYSHCYALRCLNTGTN